MRRKHWLGVLLIAALAVFVICHGNVPASAATHSHPICGSYCSCSQYDHSNSTWQAWDGKSTMYNGYYYLTKDVTLSSTMILNYSYTSYLCLNGYSITCADTVFDIYSYRSLLITDCKGTGKVETTGGDCAISNNKNLTIWGGTIVNSSTDESFASAINSYNGTNTTICGGKVTAKDADAIYAFPGSNITVLGGTVNGGGQYGSAISGQGTVERCGTITISGGRITQDRTWHDVLDIQDGSFVMTGGYVDGNVTVYDEEGTTTVSGGTINGSLNVFSGSASITGGSLNNGFYLYSNTTVSGGTYGGSCTFVGTNITVNGGNFSNCSTVSMSGEVWVCGGSFSTLQALNNPLHLSGVPDIATLQIYKPGTVSAQNKDCTGSFGGETVQVKLYYPYDSYAWKDGDIVIKNVKSNAVAQKFQLTGDDTRYMYLERSGNNLVLRILPHGTWGSNATWVLQNGTLTISGTGALDKAYSGTKYPWGQYASQIEKVVVEPGITEIHHYAFEYCEQLTSASLPETLTFLNFQAFQDCGKLNNLLLPSSLTSVYGYEYRIGSLYTFLRCQSLTDLYYRGTQADWETLLAGMTLSSLNSDMTIHFLQLQESTATCTAPGKQAYYQFDNTAVYGDMYDAAYQTISSLQTVPALGHDYIDHEAKAPTDTSVGWEAYQTCSRCDYSTYVEIPATALASGTCGGNLTWILSQDGTLTISGTGAMYDYAYDLNSPTESTHPWKDVAASIKSVIIENGVINIGAYAFHNCKSLETVTVGNKVLAIEPFAFYNCTSLADVTFGETVATIDNCAFAYCGSLTAVTIPDSVTLIGNSAFNRCDSLTAVFYRGTESQKNSMNIKDSRLTDAPWHYPVTDTVFEGQNCYYCPDCDGYFLPNGQELRQKATVTFVDEDGTVLSEKIYYRGDAVTPPADPTKASDNVYTYTFAGWDKPVVSCTGNTTYTATYTSTYIDYTVAFVDWNEDILCVRTCHWGDPVIVPSDPSRAADKVYTYAFAGWNKVVTNCAGNATYKATYEATYIDYTVTFRYADGTTIDVQILHYGDSVAIPKTPAAPDAYSEFVGWDREVTDCTADAVYTAVFVMTRIPGDVDGSGEVTELDAIYLLKAILMPELFPLEYEDDFDGNGKLDEDDAIYLLQHVLLPEQFPL